MLVCQWRIWGSSPHFVGTNIQSSREAKWVGCVWILSWGLFTWRFPWASWLHIAVCRSFMDICSLKVALCLSRRENTPRETHGGNTNKLSYLNTASCVHYRWRCVSLEEKTYLGRHLVATPNNSRYMNTAKRAGLWVR